ncbi:beta barrel domain-containing protein [Acetobacter persici]|uniref:Uncharacterized protein n=1 Tax=Acetobacter persici TaxID=1076596 RepID=A0A1U9LJN7_9PROT|nr:hypothetical protein A0U91_16255 [Acetobacter persici]
MVGRDVSFLNDLKKGDEVYLVTADYKGRKAGKSAFVISRGPKWIWVSVSGVRHGERFQTDNGISEGGSGHRSELWPSEASWGAEVHRKEIWIQFRNAVTAKYDPPVGLTVENIETMAALLNSQC